MGSVHGVAACNLHSQTYLRLKRAILLALCVGVWGWVWVCGWVGMGGVGVGGLYYIYIYNIYI